MNLDNCAITEVFALIFDTFKPHRKVYKEDSGIHLMCMGKGHGSGDGQLDLPMGISIDTSKRLIYVCEGGNRRVSVFSCENYSFRSKFGSSGSGPGEFMKPEVRVAYFELRIRTCVLSRACCFFLFCFHRQGIYVDSARQLVYVTDNYLHRIVVYSTVS